MKGQHKSHSDLYTDENPKGTIKGLKFATVKDVKHQNRSGKSNIRYKMEQELGKIHQIR